MIELLFEWTRMFKSMGKFMSSAFSGKSFKKKQSTFSSKPIHQ